MIDKAGAEELGPEREALLVGTAIGMADGMADRLRDIFREHSRAFDWGLFLDETVRQRVTALFWANMMRGGLVHDLEPLIPRNHEHFLRMVYGGNRIRNLGMLEALSEILRRARERDLQMLVRKGVYLSTVAYQDLGARLMADVDLLIRRSDSRRGVELLEDLGYRPGVLARDLASFAPHSRSDVARISLTMPNVPAMVRLDRSPVLPAIEVDLTTGLFERGTGFDFPVDDVFARAEPTNVGDAAAHVATTEDFMIDLCAHLYKHAKSLVCIGRGTDLNLSRFCDVALYAGVVSRRDRWQQLVTLTHNTGLQEPLYFALYWTEQLYPGVVSHDVLGALAPPGDDDFLYRFGDHEKKAGMWAVRDLYARLFDHTRQWNPAGSPRAAGMASSQGDGRRS